MISDVEFIMGRNSPYEVIFSTGEKTYLTIKDIEKVRYFNQKTQEWIEVSCKEFGYKSPFTLMLRRNKEWK